MQYAASGLSMTLLMMLNAACTAAACFADRLRQLHEEQQQIHGRDRARLLFEDTIAKSLLTSLSLLADHSMY